MGKASIDDGLTDHPKFLAAGPVAGWLWLASVLYCRRTLTDGLVPKVKVPTLVLGLKKPHEAAATLVRVGLWHEAGDYYEINHYLKMNPSKAQVQNYQEQDRVRKQERRRVSGQPVHETSTQECDESIEDDRRTRSTTRATRAKSESESASASESGFGSSGSGSSEKSPRETHALSRLPTWQNPAALVGKHHLCPPETWGACDRGGLCVPGFLAAEWRAQCGGDEATITAFVDDEIAHLPAGPVGDPVKFWRGRWDARFRAKTAGGSRTGDTVAAARALLKEG